MNDERKEDPKAPTLGQRVSDLMAKVGLNQTQLSEKTGIERTQLSRLIRDLRKPTPHEVPWLAVALGVSPEELLEGVEVSGPTKKAIDELSQVARRVIAAERERDEALANLKQLEQAVAGERQAFEQERQQTEERHTREVRGLEQQITANQKAIALSRREIETASQQSAYNIARLEEQNGQLDAKRNWYAGRLKQVEAELAQERANKTSATIGAAGLALLFGYGLGSSGL